MFCKKCGRQIDGNQMFCPGCGTPVTMNPVNNTNANGKKKRSKLPLLIALLLGAFLLLIVIAIAMFFIFKSRNSGNTGTQDSGLTTNQAGQNQAGQNNTEEDDPYNAFIKNELIPKYGMYPFEQSGATDVDDISTRIDRNNPDEYWMDDVGVMGSQIVDLDKDGVDEIFLVRMDAALPNPDYDAIERYMYLSVYEYDGENFTLADEILWLPEHNGDQDISEIVFYSNPVVDKYAAVSLLDKGDQWLIFNEYKYAGELLNGVVHGYWTLSYDGSSFHTFAQYILNALDQTKTSSSSDFANKLFNYYKGYDIAIDKNNVDLYGYAKDQSILDASEIEGPTVSLLLSSDGKVGNNQKNPMTAKLNDRSPFHETYENQASANNQQGSGGSATANGSDGGVSGNGSSATGNQSAGANSAAGSTGQSLDATALQAYVDEAIDKHIEECYVDVSLVRFGFIDLDNNGIPELLISHGDYHASVVGVYTYYNGKVVELEGFGSQFGMFSYEKGQGSAWVISNYFGNGGYITDTVYCLENGLGKQSVKMYYTSGADNQGITYELDDVTVSREDFFAVANQVFQDHTFTYIEYEELYDYSSAVINDYHDYLVEGSEIFTKSQAGLED